MTRSTRTILDSGLVIVDFGQSSVRTGSGSVRSKRPRIISPTDYDMESQESLDPVATAPGSDTFHAAAGDNGSSNQAGVAKFARIP